MNKINVGHIGWLARDEGPDCQTVAWCDINADKMKQSAAKHPDIRMYTDYREMLNHPGLNAVVISTPNWVHAEQTIAFLESGRSVFVEKPMGINKAECDRILQTVARTGLAYTVDFEMRISPLAEFLKDAVDSGRHGALRRIEFIHHRGCWLEEGNGLWRVRPEKSGGHFFMEPIHEVDIFRYLAGEVQAVQTISGPNVLPHYGFPDNLCCHLFFRSGVVATLLATHTLSAWLPYKDQSNNELMQSRGHNMEMIFTLERASIHVDCIQARVLVNPIVEYPIGTRGKRVEFSSADVMCGGKAHEFTHDIAKMRKEFIRRCAEGRPTVQDPIDIWKTHMVCLAAEKSMIENGQRIEIDYTLPPGVR
jgi:predicted dehydrogenase